MSSGCETTLSRASHKSMKTPKANLNRKLEHEFNKSLLNSEKRRLKSFNEYKNISSSSSSAASSDGEDETHIESMLKRSKNHLENIEALKRRRELLRPEDYVSH